MATDQRILDKFQEEFVASKARAAGYQATIDDLNAKLAVAQSHLADENSVQAAINQTLVALGEAPLT